MGRAFPRMKVYFQDGETPQVLMKQVISAGQRFCKLKNCEVSISFVPPHEIQQLNRQYRGMDKPTDVLSFPVADTRSTNLGDIIICHQVAAAQAQEYGHSLERELAFLTAHGFLHLVGYDHLTPQDEAEMIAAQKAILDRVGATR